MLHIATDPALKANIAEGFGGMLGMMAGQLETQYGPDLAIPPHALALAVQSMAMGFIYQAILSPEATPPSAVLAAYEALADGAIRRASPPAASPVDPRGLRGRRR